MIYATILEAESPRSEGPIHPASSNSWRWYGGPWRQTIRRHTNPEALRCQACTSVSTHSRGNRPGSPRTTLIPPRAGTAGTGPPPTKAHLLKLLLPPTATRTRDLVDQTTPKPTEQRCFVPSLLNPVSLGSFRAKARALCPQSWEILMMNKLPAALVGDSNSTCSQGSSQL